MLTDSEHPQHFQNSHYEPLPKFTEIAKELELDVNLQVQFIKLQEIFIQFWNSPEARPQRAQAFRALIHEIQDARFDPLGDLLTIAETYWRLPEGVRNKIQKCLDQMGFFPDYSTCLQDRLVIHFIEAIEGKGIALENALPYWGHSQDKAPARPFVMSFSPTQDAVEYQEAVQYPEELLDLEKEHPGMLKELEALAKTLSIPEPVMRPVEVNGEWYI